MNVHVYGICFSEDLQNTSVFNMSEFSHSEDKTISKFRKQTEEHVKAWTDLCWITDEEKESVYIFLFNIRNLSIRENGDNFGDCFLPESLGWIIPLALYRINNPNQKIEL